MLEIEVAEFWIKIQKIGQCFYLIMFTCGTKNVDFRKRCKPPDGEGEIPA